MRVPPPGPCLSLGLTIRLPRASKGHSPLITRHFFWECADPKRLAVTPLECAVTKITRLTPLECAVTKKVGGWAGRPSLTASMLHHATLHTFPHRYQRRRQGLFRDAGHKRFDHPLQYHGNVACQGNHFALHVHSAVALFHPPPRFHAPQESAVVARHFFALVALARVLHFRNAHRGTPAMRSLRTVMEMVTLMLGVQHHGDYLVPPKPQEHPEVVPIPRFDLRPFHIRPVVHGMAVVVSHHPKHIFASS